MTKHTIKKYTTETTQDKNGNTVMKPIYIQERKYVEKITAMVYGGYDETIIEGHRVSVYSDLRNMAEDIRETIVYIDKVVA